MTSDLLHIAQPLRALAIPLAEIQPDAANARRHPPENVGAIRASLAAFGQQKPVVVDHRGVCLAGNGVLAAAVALGWSHLAAVRSELQGPRARAYSIADNRSTDTSDWHLTQLAEQLAALQNDLPADYASAGFSDAQIDDMIDQSLRASPDEQQDDPREVAVPELHQVLVACCDESQQRALYERLSQEGYSCRVLTL